MGGEEGNMDLDKIIEEGMHKFTGQDSAMEMRSPIEAPGHEGGTPKEDDGRRTTDDRGQQKPDDGRQTTEDSKSQTTDAEKEAEAAEQQEAARVKGLEEENEALKGRIEAFDGAKATEKANAEFGKKIFDFSREQNAKALGAIDKLDPDEFKSNEEYQDKVAEIWATKDEAIATFTRTLSTEPATGTAGKGGEIAQPGAEAGKGSATVTAGTPGTAGAGKPAAGTAGKPAWDEVASAAQAEKIDPSDPDFLSYCRQAPKTDAAGKAIPFAEQVNWAISETKELKALKELRKQGKEISAADVAARIQASEQPMGRGAGIISPAGGGPGGQEKTAKPISLDDALGFAEERRTL